MRWNLLKKKYPSGLVPINFKLAGKIILPLGAVFTILGISALFLNLATLPITVLVIGVGFIIAGIYLLVVLPTDY